ncbi:hypothetical protein OIU84_016169 [Salix udensis]|uniref:Uncharacterized protein n=1 Tax=Salix udensis TaxID=889485 RepID=A0AAD6JAQ7_9ROSI|nr:hypothetical protein OIU84_016169 [Salix udensis]
MTSYRRRYVIGGCSCRQLEWSKNSHVAVLSSGKKLPNKDHSVLSGAELGVRPKGATVPRLREKSSDCSLEAEGFFKQ